MKDAPWYHYPFSTIGLLWFLLSAIDYTLTKLQFAPYLDAFTPDQIAYFTNLPLYVDFAWALNVWFGFFAAFLLWRRNHSAALFFAISFAGIIVASVGLIFLTEPPLFQVTGKIGVWVMVASIIATILFYTYARAMNVRQRGN